MATFSHSEVVLLALLFDGPAHAYELVQRVQAMEVEKWARVRESTLYASLLRLEGEGFVRGEAERGERAKSKRTYTITAEGRNRLRELVSSGLNSPAPIYSDLLVAALFAAAHEHDADLRAATTAIQRSKAALTETMRDPRLSMPGRVVVSFYIGLADLHTKALTDLRQLADTARPTRARDSTIGWPAG